MPPVPTPSEDKPRPLGVYLRNSFAAGVAIVLPFAVTIWLIYTFVRFIDTSIAPLLPAPLGDAVDRVWGFGVVIAVLLLTLLGALAGNYFGRIVVGESERLLEGLPIIRSVYGGAKQVFKQVAAPEKQSFKEAVLVQFPRPGMWTIGFVTNDDPVEVTGALGADIVAVYVPQAPIPTTGFIFYVPRADLVAMPFGPEEALKRVLSLGMVKPVEPAAEVVDEVKV